MDRSSFNFAGSTNDLEKRQAYKAKLAGQIEPSRPKELPVIDNTFNGVSPGGVLVHPSLGDGILVKVDHKNNEVLIDFGTKGLIGLVLSQAKSFVHAPITISEKGVQGGDAFLGGEIQSRIIAPQDRDHREVDFSKVISPDFIEPKKSFYPAGTKVWHPDLGACLVLAVDEKTNHISLSSEATGIVDMVLSQVRSKLRAIETTPEHVPMKPFVREPLAPQVPQYKSRGDVSVKLPEVFKSWQRNQQFMFLTRSQKLTTEQANDVFAVISGDKPMFHSVTLAWQTQEEVQATIIPGPEAISPVIEGIKPSILDEKTLWHPDFGECSVASVDEKKNELILLTSVGQVPFVMDVTLPRLAVLTASAPEHAPKRLGTRVLVTSDTPVDERPKVSVIIPEVFVTWRVLEQYQFLTRQVAPEHANNIIDTLSGKLHSSDTEYEIQWTDNPPESDKRGEFKDKLLQRVTAASVEQELPAPPAPIDPGIRRVFEEVVTVNKHSINRVSVRLPLDFKTWTSSGQYVFLTRTKQLTFNEANDFMDILQGKSIKSATKYEIIWDQVGSVAYASEDSYVQRTIEEIEVVDKTPVLKKVVITMPFNSKKWTASQQFSFLTTARQLTFNEANDVLSIIQNKPVNSKVQYELIWSE